MYSCCFTCVIASFGFNCSETPRTSAGAPRLSFRRTVLCVLKGRDTTIAFLASMADCKRPLRNAAAKWSSVSRLMGRSSGKGSCRPSMVLNPTWGRRSRLPVTSRREIPQQGNHENQDDTTSDHRFPGAKAAQGTGHACTYVLRFFPHRTHRTGPRSSCCRRGLFRPRKGKLDDLSGSHFDPNIEAHMKFWGHHWLVHNSSARANGNVTYSYHNPG